MDLPKRQQSRLQGYDYSRNGAYFVTVCVKNRRNILWNVGARIARPNDGTYELSEYGTVVARTIERIPLHYSSVCVDKYVVMPNHIHIMLSINNGVVESADGRAMRAPTISTIINQMKGSVTKQIGAPIWQRSFYDHIIRDEDDYLTHWQYIDANPLKWDEDDLYIA